MMLTGMHIAIIGGDARQLEVIRKLVELDAKLSLVASTSSPIISPGR
ncbi:Dipicolinate synthase subunit A [Geobacillus sp. BCO2]|nr:Dipicolinate synthase subunit A [Geobacillus sp. BCO2]